MNAALHIPGLSNLWVQPIRNRIDMLSTGIKSPVGIKIAGPDLKVIEKIGEQVEATVKDVPGTRSAYAERVRGGRYIEVRIDRVRAARFGLSLADVQQVVALAIGGENVGETVEGLQRFPINIRYPRELRDSVEKLTRAADRHRSGCDHDARRRRRSRRHRRPAADRAARMHGSTAGSMWTSAGAISGGYVAQAQKLVAQRVKLAARILDYLVGSVRISGACDEETDDWSCRSRSRSSSSCCISPSAASTRAALIMGTLPFALVGGLWLLFLLGYNLSIASAIGFIALAGVVGGIWRHDADLSRSRDRKATPGEPISTPKRI